MPMDPSAPDLGKPPQAILEIKTGFVLHRAQMSAAAFLLRYGGPRVYKAMPAASSGKGGGGPAVPP
jgi:hypothetical protein